MATKESKKKNSGRKIPGPTNPMVTPILTDHYQFTMAYAYWKSGKHQERAVCVIPHPACLHVFFFFGLDGCSFVYTFVYDVILRL